MFDLNIVRAVLLIVLAVGGNYVGETLGCGTQKLLSNNMVYKQIFTLFLIYFTITFTDSSEIPSHPSNVMIKSLIVWSLYFLFTRMHLGSTIISFFILISLYVATTFKDYYKKLTELKLDTNTSKYENYVKIYDNLVKGLTYILLGTILISFIIYLFHKKKEYGKSFTLYRFFTGVIHCKNMKPLSH